MSSHLLLLVEIFMLKKMNELFQIINPIVDDYDIQRMMLQEKWNGEARKIRGQGPFDLKAAKQEFGDLLDQLSQVKSSLMEAKKAKAAINELYTLFHEKYRQINYAMYRSKIKLEYDEAFAKEIAALEKYFMPDLLVIKVEILRLQVIYQAAHKIAA